VEARARTIGCFILGLFGVILFMTGGSLVIWALHYLMWNSPPVSDFLWRLPDDVAAILPIATPLGLFLIGLGVLLIVWSGAGLSYNSQTVSTLRDNEQEEARGTVSVKAQCPHCNAVYLYRLRETESARTVTCQNCGRRFEVT